MDNPLLSPAEVAAEVKTLVTNITFSRYFIMSGFVILIYDHAITFSDEVELVWKRPKNLVSWVFLVNRYLTPCILALDLYDKSGFATNLTVEFCRRWVFAESILHLLTQAAIHALVAIRVNALWGNTRATRIGLFLAWTFYFAPALTIALVAVIQDEATFRPNPIIHSCFGLVGGFVWTVWVPPMILEIVLFSMTVVKMAHQNRRWITSVPLAYVLYRDGLIYFTVIALCSVFNLVVWKFCPISLFALAKYFSLGLVNAMGARMVLNLREQGTVEIGRDSPPLRVHFIDPRQPFMPYDQDDRHKDLSTLEPRRHEPYGTIRDRKPDLEFDMIGETDTCSETQLDIEQNLSITLHEAQEEPHDDAEYYNQRIAKLRNLKAVRRSGTSYSTRSAPTPRSPLRTDESGGGDCDDLEMLPIPPSMAPPIPPRL